MERLHGGLTRLVRWASLAGGWWLLLFSVMTCVEIVGRKLFNVSLQGIDEYGAYTLAILAALGFSLALAEGSHTRIDLLLVRLPAPVQAALNLVAALLLAAVAVLLLVRGFDVVAQSWRFMSVANSPLQTRLWIPQAVWLAALGLFTLLAGVLAARAVQLLFGDWRQLNRAFGPGHSEGGE